MAMVSPALVESLQESALLREAQPRALWRLPLWAAFLVFTALIILYPITLGLESGIVWSPDLFPNLPLFGVLFYLWAASLVGLVFTVSDERTATWEHLGLVAVAALVFRGYWNIIAPIQGQAMTHLNAAKIWQSMGHVVFDRAAGYFDWPGASLALSVLSQVTGTALVPSVAIVAVFIAILIGIATYVLMLNILKNSLYAALASLLIIAGNLALTIFYTAGPMAIVFVVIFLVVLFQRGGLDSSSHTAVALLLLTAAAVTHLHSSIHFSFFLLGLWGFALLRRRGAEPAPTLTTIALFFIIPVAWILYWGTTGFVTITRWSGAFFSDLGNLQNMFSGASSVGQANFGGSAPVWYSQTRLIWLFLLYAAGGLIWLWKMTRLRTLSTTESRLAATFAGLAILSIVSMLVSAAGSSELLRGLTYAPFFTAPFLLLFIQGLKTQVAKVILAGLAAILVFMAFPTFLSSNRVININTNHRIEFAAGQWLQSAYGTSDDLNVFLTHPIYDSIAFHLPNAILNSDIPPEGLRYTQENFFPAMAELLDRYDAASQGSGPSLFIHSTKLALVSAITLGIPVDDPRWGAIRERLAGQNHQVHDDGPAQVYSEG